MYINRRRFLATSAGGFGAAMLAGAPAAARTAEPEALVRRCLDDGLRMGLPGLVCGVLDGEGSYIAGDGRIADEGSARPDGSTVYQIGSLTKTFTGLLLAEADRAGGPRLGDPLRRHVPWTVPSRDGAEITLLHLATHSSGLPSLPEGFEQRARFDPRNPYEGATPAHMARWLAETELASKPGTKFAYSNFGVALLGQALSPRYDQMLRSLTAPLGLRDTTLCLDPGQRERKASGFDESDHAIEDWTGEAFAAAGTMTHSTVNDLLSYLRRQLEPGEDALGSSIRRTQQVLFTDPDTKLSLGLNWMHGQLRGGRRVLFHDGMTGGFASFAAFSPETGKAAVILTNTARSVTELGVRLLNELTS